MIIAQTSHHTRHKNVISRPVMITKGRDITGLKITALHDVTHVDVTCCDRHVTTFHTSHFHDSCHFPRDSRSDMKPEGVISKGSRTSAGRKMCVIKVSSAFP